MSLPDWWPPQEALRVLHGSGFNYAKTFEDINTIIRWRADSLPIALEEGHARLIRAGFFTVHGRDKHHRVVVVCRPVVAERLGLTDPHVISQAVIFVAFYVINHMQKDGVSENNVVIMDLEQALPWSLPVRALKVFNQTMQQQFKCKNAIVYVLNAHKTFTVLWGTIKGWLDPMLVNKVQLHNANTCAEL